ncbi:MAG: TolC family protein [Pseudoflavonifractor sp.]|nr:TolC family protein [Alloprevotella sp.]MCM1116007.1 TolC family protein [Pseudoflavonifractor sp.]
MKLSKYIILPMVAALAATTLGSCGIYSKFKMPTSTALTEEYVKARDAEADTAAFGNLRWQEVFTDPVLVDLIYQALDSNKDLANAKLNVDIAHARLLGAKLAYLPSVALTPNGAGASYDHSHINWTYQIPLAVSWEIDIFGKTLNNKRMAGASYQMTREAEQATRSQIIAAVANTYYAIGTTRRILDLQRETSVMWAENVQTMKDLKEAGRSGITEAAVVQAKAQYASILASITDTEAQLHELNNTMSLLQAVEPREWVTGETPVLDVPALTRDAIPMRELAARPDVRAAEYSLAAAYYATSAARSNFYPSLSISSNGGFTNLLGSMIVNPGKWFVQLAGQLTAPLFARGANISNLKATKAQQEQAMNNFESTLLSASAEVSNAMTTYAKAVEKSAFLDDQVKNLEQSVDITQTLLKIGGYNTTYLEVITAQQSLLGAQMSQLQCDLTRSSALINLYQSLGGGR